MWVYISLGRDETVVGTFMILNTLDWMENGLISGTCQRYCAN